MKDVDDWKYWMNIWEVEKFWKYDLNFIYDITFKFQQRELFGRRQTIVLKLLMNSLYFEKRIIWLTS